ncbi:unnamed protein product [Phaeothamnion confervicola]
MIGFEEDEADRPEYHGDSIASPIDGSPILYFPPHQKMARIRMALSIISMLIIIVVGCIAGIYGLKWYLVYGMSDDEDGWGYKYGKTITSLINTVQIQILNFVYKSIAIKLTIHENHRTETEYEDALITKLFCFQAVNSYGSFFYLAFIGEPLLGNKCESGGCMSLLAQNLLIIFCINIFVGNVVEVAIP